VLLLADCGKHGPARAIAPQWAIWHNWAAAFRRFGRWSVRRAMRGGPGGMPCTSAFPFALRITSPT
jgi:hypothetical protein